MSYSVTVTSNYWAPVSCSNGSSIAPGATMQFSGSDTPGLYITIPGAGSITFRDIGYNHIPGDSNETWGVLIIYQGQSIVGRYEGGGQIQATINDYAQINLEGIDFREVDLAPILIP